MMNVRYIHRSLPNTTANLSCLPEESSIFSVHQPDPPWGEYPKRSKVMYLKWQTTFWIGSLFTA